MRSKHGRHGDATGAGDAGWRERDRDGRLWRVEPQDDKHDQLVGVSEEGLPGFERAKEVRRLTGLGFVRAVRERLAPASETGPEAISIVVQFRSARGARADLAAEAQMGEAHGAPPFPAPGIPGARGFGRRPPWMWMPVIASPSPISSSSPIGLSVVAYTVRSVIVVIDPPSSVGRPIPERRPGREREPRRTMMHMT